MFVGVTLLHGNQVIEFVLRRAENGSLVGTSWCGTKELVKKMNFSVALK